MSVVDCHVHLYPPEINRATHEWAAQAGEQIWARLCTRRRRDGRPVQGFPDTDALLRAMDEAGVARAVLLGWYWETPAACTLQNRFYAECIHRHPDRLSACVTVQPASGAAALEELVWAQEQGFVGVGEMSPHGIGLGAEDPRWLEVLQRAGELGFPVVVHVTDPGSRPYPARVDTPLADFVTWARRYPQTSLVLAHGGGRVPWLMPEVRELPNVYYDTAAFPLLYPASELPDWLAQAGADRLLWGTDWPLDLYPRQVSHPAMAGFRAEVEAAVPRTEERAALLSANARRVFRLPV